MKALSLRFLHLLLAGGIAMWAPLVVTASESGEVPQIGPAEFAFRYVPRSEEPIPEVQEAPPRFGVKNSQFLTFGGGVAHNFDDAWDFNLHGAYSRFLIDHVEFVMEVGAWYFNQDGRDAFGLNPAIVFRWHLINPPEKDWTIFADAGIGVLAATREVPAGGTWFDFTPRVGVGYTQQISPAGTRLQVGARWHHISNARISGDRNNPSRDGLMVYGGVMVPF